MTYQLKGGEEIRDGKLYGWTGEVCPGCGGHGENPSQEFSRLACTVCGGTGERWCLMPVQPDNI